MSQIRISPFLRTANVWAGNSTCCRVKVGAVVFNMQSKRLLSIGYNGTLPGQVHCNKLFDYTNLLVHSDLSRYIKCEFDNDGWNKVTKQDFMELHHWFSEIYEVHAEQNAIYNLIKTGASYNADNLAIVTTVEPCSQCAKAITATGIKYVFYRKAYDRNTESISEYFANLGIICRQVESSGEVL